MDVIALARMRVAGRHGAFAAERACAQPFDLDVVVELDLRRAAASDDLADTLDYAQLHRRITQVVGSTSFALLERLAGEILDVIFSDPRVARAEVAIAKPALLEGATPSVRLRRDNPGYRD